MKDKNIVELQMDLVNKLWTRGWAGFKADAIGMEEISGGFVIGVKGGSLLVLKIVKLESGNSKKKVGNFTEELERIRYIAQPSGMMDEMDIVVGYAVARGWSGEWQFIDHDRTSISYSDKMEPLSEVIEQ